MAWLHRVLFLLGAVKTFALFCICFVWLCLALLFLVFASSCFGWLAWLCLALLGFAWPRFSFFLHHLALLCHLLGLVLCNLALFCIDCAWLCFTLLSICLNPYSLTLFGTRPASRSLRAGCPSWMPSCMPGFSRRPFRYLVGPGVFEPLYDASCSGLEQRMHA